MIIVDYDIKAKYNKPKWWKINQYTVQESELEKCQQENGESFHSSPEIGLCEGKPEHPSLARNRLGLRRAIEIHIHQTYSPLDNTKTEKQNQAKT